MLQGGVTTPPEMCSIGPMTTDRTTLMLRIEWIGSGPNPHPGVTLVAMTAAHARAIRAAYAAMLDEAITAEGDYDDPDEPGSARSFSRADARRIATGMAFRYNRIDNA